MLFLLSLGFSSTVKEWLQIPTTMTVFENVETEFFQTDGPLKLVHAQINDVNTEVAYSMTQTDRGYTANVKAEKAGDASMTMEVNGFPVKSIDVSVLPNIKVIPGGQSIGVKLNTEGVLVVGHHLVQTDEGEKSPGETAGIQVGDMITKVDDQQIQQMSEISKYVQAAGEEARSLAVEVRRDNETLTKTLQPIKSEGDHSYRMGLYIRDSAAGVGTLTFYHPESKKFGALGHVISDVDTKKPIVFMMGKLSGLRYHQLRKV